MQSKKKLSLRVCALRIALASLFVCASLHGATTTMLTGLGAGVGVATDHATQTTYFVEFTTGALKRVSSAASCSTTSSPPCTATTVASGFSHPEDVALDSAHNVAYVTTRDDAGTTGAFWRVDLTTGARSLVTFNLGAPHQIALDVATNSAYVVGYDSGRLWKIDLTTGSKVTLMKGLAHPIGLVITSSRQYAYVTEETTAKLSKIDLALGARVLPEPATGLVSPFFLGWTDPGESSLYLVERSPNNDVVRVDLPSVSRSTVISGLVASSSGVAVDWIGGHAYITSDATLARAELGALPLSSPIFLGVGFVPFSDIHDGYATTSTPRIHAKDAPFGGTIDFFGNLNRFKSAYSATHYRVVLDGTPLTATWSTERFNASTCRFDAVGIAPVAALSASTTNTLYEIPPEYPTAPERWYPPFLMMRWTSSTNGLHTFAIELYVKDPTTGAFTLVPFSAADELANSLTLMIDNDLPQVDLVQVYQAVGTPPKKIATCEIVSSGVPQFRIGINAYDPHGHLLSYSAWVNWGHNRSATVINADNYEPAHVVPSRMWYGPPLGFIGPTPPWTATCNCAHIFYVGAWKRTINGYWLTSYGQGFQAITINNVTSPTACP